MSKKIFLDTLYVIALVNQRDQYHARAAVLADTYENRQFITTDAVLLEIGNALARNFRAQAVEIIERFLSSENVEVIHLSEEKFAEAFAFYMLHADKQWGLIDCLSFVVMRKEGIQEALTFDQHFVQAGFQALLRETNLNWRTAIGKSARHVRSKLL